jgi:hypothetical protein
MMDLIAPRRFDSSPRVIPMSVFRLVVRSIALLAYAVWVGGFTFYGAVVLWVIHDTYGSLEAGQITQKVTDWMNLIGVVTLPVWWYIAWLERRATPKLARYLLIGLLAISTGLLAFLFVDHQILDRRLETYGLTGFYAYHSVYLNASTAQWAANLLLIPVVLRLWQADRSSAEPSVAPNVAMVK